MADLLERLQRALTSRYRIERELGRGGMATVYLAQDLKHDRPVAIKVLDPEVTAAIGPERFLREVKTVARLTHPHILPLHDSGEADGLLFYVMPYVEGESLRARLEREKQLPVEDALRISREVAEALSYAHGRGVVHRDIKPENVLLEEGHAVVADFGIARAVMAAGGEKLTATGVALGTPAYMSPEQSTGGRDLDGRSDLYSLGCVLYEMLAGVPPFSGPTAESLAHQHLNVAPRPVTEVRPTVPARVSAALEMALAKAPADRFGTVTLFAETLGGRESSVESAVVRTPVAAERRRHWTWLAGGAAAALVLLAVITSQYWGPFAGWLGGPDGHAPGKKDWILVAEFEGPAGDSTLAGAVRDLVSAALDQSELVATVPRDQIRLALEMAGKPASTRVDGQLAQELAYRSAVRAVVVGTIGRIGQGYSVVLRVVDADTTKVILTERATAKNEDALIPTVGRLAEKLRASLGERRAAIHATRPMTAVATPSFEAYRLLVEAERLVDSLASRKAIPVLRDALALDPDFALAWGRLGFAFGNVGEPDSAQAAFEEALHRPRRLTTAQRLTLEGQRAATDGDMLLAIATFERALHYDPHDPRILGALAVGLGRLGRVAEALERTRAAMAASPFGVSEILRGNEVIYLRSLGRMDEARGIARQLQGAPGHVSRVYLEVAAATWGAAESLAVAALARPNLDDDQRSQVLLLLGAAQAARGALETAEAALKRDEEVAHGVTTSVGRQNQARRSRLMLTMVTGRTVPLPVATWPHDSSTTTILTHGLHAAMAGDLEGARLCLRAVQTRPRRDLERQGATPALLAARIEALAGNWQEAARILQPFALQPMEIGSVPYTVGLSAVRWFLADAFEGLGHPDSAATCLERIILDPASTGNAGGTSLRGLATPFAHIRLVLLYARMGRLEEARRHWNTLSETVRTPDRKMAPLIAVAHAALMSAEGMARSAEH